MFDNAIKELELGNNVTIKPRGNSMTPIIKSGESVTLIPATVKNVKKGDVVLCKISGRKYLHLVTKVGSRSAQISNNHGRVNGWTRKVYGKVLFD